MQRHDDRYGGRVCRNMTTGMVAARVPPEKQKTKVAILKIILSLTGSQ